MSKANGGGKQPSFCINDKKEKLVKSRNMKGAENKMNELTSFEQDLKVAYLNYENGDLSETLKVLDRMIKFLFKNDTQNDPFWNQETSNIFKAVILNNFYNKKELKINDLNLLLADQDEMKRNIIEFGNNFKDNELIEFISVSNISDNTLKDVIEIIMKNIGKMNIMNTNMGKNIEKDKSKIDCFCGHSFNFDWSKIPNTEKIAYLKCPNCGAELKRLNPNYHDIHADYEKEEILEHVNTIYNNGKQIINKLHNDDNEVINKLRMSYNNIFEDWNLLKSKKVDLKDFFAETEKEAVIELYKAKEKATVFGTSLSQLLDSDNLTCNDEIVKLLIDYFGNASIYDRNFGTSDTGLPCEKLSIDNVHLFRAVLVINVLSIIEHITDVSLPLCLELTFEEKVFIEILGPIFKTFIPKIFDNINDVKFYYKNNSLNK